jgi:hypothetical protein
MKFLSPLLTPGRLSAVVEQQIRRVENEAETRDEPLFCGLSQDNEIDGVLNLWEGDVNDAENAADLRKRLVDQRLRFAISPLAQARAFLQHAGSCRQNTKLEPIRMDRLSFLAACLARLSAHTPILVAGSNVSTLTCFSHRVKDFSKEYDLELLPDLVTSIASLGILLLPSALEESIFAKIQVVFATKEHAVLKSIWDFETLLEVGRMPASCCEALMLLAICFGPLGLQTKRLLERLEAMAMRAPIELAMLKMKTERTGLMEALKLKGRDDEATEIERLKAELAATKRRLIAAEAKHRPTSVSPARQPSKELREKVALARQDSKDRSANPPAPPKPKAAGAPPPAPPPVASGVPPAPPPVASGVPPPPPPVAPGAPPPGGAAVPVAKKKAFEQFKEIVAQPIEGKEIREKGEIRGVSKKLSGILVDPAKAKDLRQIPLVTDPTTLRPDPNRRKEEYLSTYAQAVQSLTDDGQKPFQIAGRVGNKPEEWYKDGVRSTWAAQTGFTSFLVLGTTIPKPTTSDVAVQDGGKASKKLIKAKAKSSSDTSYGAAYRLVMKDMTLHSFVGNFETMYDLEIADLMRGLWGRLTKEIAFDKGTFQKKDFLAWVQTLGQELLDLVTIFLQVSDDPWQLDETLEKDDDGNFVDEKIDALINKLRIIRYDDAQRFGMFQTYDTLKGEFDSLQDGPDRDVKRLQMNKEFEAVARARVLLANPGNNVKGNLKPYMSEFHKLFFRMRRYGPRLNAVLKFADGIGDIQTELTRIQTKITQINAICDSLRNPTYTQIRLLLYDAVNTWTFYQDDAQASRIVDAVQSFNDIIFKSNQTFKEETDETTNRTKFTPQGLKDLRIDGNLMRVYFFLAAALESDDLKTVYKFLQVLRKRLNELGTTSIPELFKDITAIKARSDEGTLMNNIKGITAAFTPKTVTELVGPNLKTPASMGLEQRRAEEAVNLVLENIRTQDEYEYDIDKEEHAKGSATLESRVSIISIGLQDEIKAVEDIECSMSLAQLVAPLDIDSKTSDDEKRVKADESLQTLRTLCSDFIVGIEQFDPKIATRIQEDEAARSVLGPVAEAAASVSATPVPKAVSKPTTSRSASWNSSRLPQIPSVLDKMFEHLEVPTSMTLPTNTSSELSLPEIINLFRDLVKDKDIENAQKEARGDILFFDAIAFKARDAIRASFPV